MRTIFIFFILSFSMSLFSQQIIALDYDAAGNRIHRKVVILKQNNTFDQLTTDKQEKKSEYQHEMLGEKEIRVYPNPTKGLLGISIIGTKSESPVLIRVYESNGSMILRLNLDNCPESQIDLSQYPTGIYILSILLDGINKEFKIIKE